MKLHFSAIALLAAAASALEGDDVFDASALVAAARANVGAERTTSRYPRALELTLPYKSSNLQLHLEANTALFSQDWSAASWDDAGEIVDREENAEDYMCHYLGSVVGMPDSIVAMSVCDDIGIQGRIASFGAGLDIGVRATDLSLRSITNVGEHVIYNMTSVMEGVQFGDVDAEFEGGDSIRDENANGPQNDMAAENSRSRYVNNAVFVSSRQRLQQFGSNSQERASTQSDVNTALSYYLDRDSRWSGDPPTHTIRTQEQNPSGYDQSPGDPIRKCREYKRDRWSGADNLQCLRVNQSGEPAGEAFVGTMCDRQYSSGWSSTGSNGNQRRLPVVIAHEMGHNYGFNHESRGIMQAAVQYDETYFGSNAISEWSRRRDNYGCLR